MCVPNVRTQQDDVSTSMLCWSGSDICQCPTFATSNCLVNLMTNSQYMCRYLIMFCELAIDYYLHSSNLWASIPVNLIISSQPAFV